MTLEKIVPLAGYHHKESLSAVSNREVGETPEDCRKAEVSGSTLVSLGTIID